MLIILIRKLFNVFIGKVPEGKKEQLKEDFEKLLSSVVKAAAEGAVKGAKHGK